jgi:predicted N-acetyltransferase YhbS
MAKVQFELGPLGLRNLDEIHAFWPRACPLHPLTPDLLAERLFGSGTAAEELALAARDDAGDLVGLAVGVFPCMGAAQGGIRWLAVAPDKLGQGIEAALLDELCARLAERGAERVRLMGTPPYYLRPGIDTREMDLLTTLLDLGWTHEATHFNMTVDLDAWRPPAGLAAQDSEPDARGYRVRRATAVDRGPFARYVAERWTLNWRDEARQAFQHDPVTLFLALKGEEIAGFAAYEVSQCLGGFGPTGVSPEHRGVNLGRRTLWACLASLQAAGRRVCEIGWIGPVPFYYRACGAHLGPCYWLLSKELKAPV